LAWLQRVSARKLESSAAALRRGGADVIRPNWQDGRHPPHPGMKNSAPSGRAFPSFRLNPVPEKKGRRQPHRLAKRQKRKE